MSHESSGPRLGTTVGLHEHVLLEGRSPVAELLAQPRLAVAESALGVDGPVELGGRYDGSVLQSAGRPVSHGSSVGRQQRPDGCRVLGESLRHGRGDGLGQRLKVRELLERQVLTLLRDEHSPEQPSALRRHLDRIDRCEFLVADPGLLGLHPRSAAPRLLQLGRSRADVLGAVEVAPGARSSHDGAQSAWFS